MTSIPSASATARSARSTLTAVVAALLQPLGERGRLLAGHRQVLLHGRCPGPGAADQALGPVAQLAVDQRLGRLLLDQLGQGGGGPLEQELAGVVRAGRPPCARGWRRATRPTVSNSPRFSPTHSSVSSGGTSSWTFLTATVKSAGSSVPLGVGGERQLVAGGGADQVLVEVRGDPAPADLVQPVLGGEPGDGLAVALGGDVQGDEVARWPRAGRRRPARRGGAARRRPRSSTSSSATAMTGSSTRRPA